jgi:hypothetical protein
MMNKNLSCQGQSMLIYRRDRTVSFQYRPEFWKRHVEKKGPHVVNGRRTVLLQSMQVIKCA